VEDTVIVLAVICLLLAALVVVLMLSIGFGPPITFATAIGNVTTRPFWIFLLGAATLLVAMMGLSLLRNGTRRKVQRRREIKQLRKAAQEPHTTSGSGSAGGSAGGSVGGSAGARPGDPGAGDGPDRTLIRDDRGNARTGPGTTVSGSAAADDTQSGTRHREP
jgi:hypothetical protein